MSKFSMRTFLAITRTKPILTIFSCSRVIPEAPETEALEVEASEAESPEAEAPEAAKIHHFLTH